MVFGILMFTKMPTAEAYIAHAVPREIRATVLGIYFFTGTEVSALLTPAIGKLIDTSGFRIAFLIVCAAMSAVAVASTVVLAALVKRSREERRKIASGEEGRAVFEE
jgi:MFS family permease